jgi:hypothetical protein
MVDEKINFLLIIQEKSKLYILVNTLVNLFQASNNCENSTIKFSTKVFKTNILFVSKKFVWKP